MKTSKCFLVVLVVLLVAIVTMGFAEIAVAKSLYVISDTGISQSTIETYRIAASPDYLVYEATNNSRRCAVGLAIDSVSGFLFVTYEGSNTLDIIDGGTMKTVGQIEASEASNLAGIVVDESKRRVYTVDRDTPFLYVYDWDAANMTLSLNDKKELNGIKAIGLALDQTNGWLFVTDRFSRIVCYFDTTTWNQVGSFVLDHTPIGIAVDEGKGLVYTGNANNNWKNGFLDKYVIETGEKTSLKTFNITDIYWDNVVGLAVDQETNLLYITTGSMRQYDGSDRLIVLDSDLNVFKQIQLRGDPAGLCIPRGNVSYNPLNLTKEADPNRVLVYKVCVQQNEYIDYLICFDNAKNKYRVNNVQVIDSLDYGLLFISASGGNYDDGEYDGDNHTVTWDIGTLEAEAGRSCVSLRAKVKWEIPGGATITNCVTINGDEVWPIKLCEDVIVCPPVPDYPPLPIIPWDEELWPWEETTFLMWIPGVHAATHDVYFGCSFDDVNNGIGGTFKGNQTSTIYDAGRLNTCTTYYWRIDEVNDVNIWRGEVWSFTTGEPGITYAVAHNPNPSDGTECVAFPVLRWARGCCAAWHDVYFGVDENVVASADTSDTTDTYRGRQLETSYTVPEAYLGVGQTYYWRVDEVLADGTVFKGKVWTYDAWRKECEQPPVLYKDDVKWSQPPDKNNEGCINGWDELSSYNSGPIIADDWLCKDDRPIKDIHWWGSFKGWTERIPPEDEMPSAFHIGIWTDVPDPEPNNPNTFSHPGKLLWENICDCYVWSLAGYDLDPRSEGEDDACFKFDQLLSQDKWFYQDPCSDGTVYWLSIAAIYDDCDDAGDCLVVDDFESYAEPCGRRIFQTWIDGKGFFSCTPFNPGNGTGSQVGWITPPFVEQTVVHCDRQSMPLLYDNDGTVNEGTIYETTGTYYYSEATANTSNLVIGNDWTIGDIKVLSLWFYGDPDNDATTTEQMYVKVNGVKVLYSGNMSDIQQPQWHQWCIDLADFSGVDLGNVTTFSIGFGNESATTPGGSGVVYFDDIRLCNECTSELEHPWGWKTRPHFYNDDAVRITDVNDGLWPPIIGSVWENGEPIEYPEGTSWDMAFALTTNRKYPEGDSKSADLNGDGIVNAMDLAILAKQWLDP